MHAAQFNEFVGAIGHHHIISPIGYGKIMKTVVRGTPVRSATEQHAIHVIAAQFFSHILYVPRVYELVDQRSYVMAHLLPGHYVSSEFYKTNMEFLKELNRFFKFMMAEGYYPFNFTILHHETGMYSLLDFSQFGTYHRGTVRFKHLLNPISLFDAERNYGILSFLVSHEMIIDHTDYYSDSEKIDILLADDVACGLPTIL
jgi:hypothetical protein